MTIIEAGIFAGAPVGAVVGGILGARSHGFWGISGFAAGGLIAGAAAGWVFATILIVFLSITGVFWRAARKRPTDPPSEADMRMMTPVAVAGTFVGFAAFAIGLLLLHWVMAVTVLLFSAALVALLAVARCELRKVTP